MKGSMRGGAGRGPTSGVEEVRPRRLLGGDGAKALCHLAVGVRLAVRVSAARTAPRHEGA